MVFELTGARALVTGASAFAASIKEQIRTVVGDTFAGEYVINSTNGGSVSLSQDFVDALRAKGKVYEGRLPPPKGAPVDDYEDREQTLFRSTDFGDDVDRPADLLELLDRFALVDDRLDDVVAQGAPPFDPLHSGHGFGIVHDPAQGIVVHVHQQRGLPLARQERG